VIVTIFLKDDLPQLLNVGTHKTLTTQIPNGWFGCQDLNHPIDFLQDR